MHNPAPANEEVVILGNGPSFKADVEANTPFFEKRPCLCVNDFPRTDYFTRLKPKYYLVVDPAYWADDASAAVVRLRDNIFSAIRENCDWQLVAFFPLEAQSKLPMNLFLGKPNIRIVFFNNTPLWGFDAAIHVLIRRGLGMFPAYNVLVIALTLSINIGYRKILVFGADHSWHQNLWLSWEGVVCLRDSHFYDSAEPKLVPFYSNPSETATFRMHEILQRCADVFEGYLDVQRYAQSRGAEILNGSSITFIDAFKRFSLPK